MRRRASRFSISIHANDRFDEITQVNRNMENIHMRPAFNHLHTAPITCLMSLGESRMHHYYLPELRYIQYSMLRSNNNHVFLSEMRGKNISVSGQQTTRTNIEKLENYVRIDRCQRNNGIQSTMHSPTWNIIPFSYHMFVLRFYGSCRIHLYISLNKSFACVCACGRSLI